MPTAIQKAPKYCLHKPSGRAYVRIRGRVRYCGRHGTHESLADYGRLIAELAATPGPQPLIAGGAGSITIVELAAACLDFAEGYYVKDGKPTDHAYLVRRMAVLLGRLYGRTPAHSFGPLALRAVQQGLIDKGDSRTTVNSSCGAIKRMFKWAASHELIPVGTYQAVAAVPGLKTGRTKAREPRPVQPVEAPVVEATLPHLPPVVADMVRFERLTGCRPSEVRQLRPADMDRSGEVWEYRPASHKTEHHHRERVVFIGPQAQAVNYVLLRRHLGSDYLALLQFFLNHRRFLRSERPERTGKSPAELLNGSPHPHWLEMLGYVQFSRN